MVLIYTQTVSYGYILLRKEFLLCVPLFRFGEGRALETLAFGSLQL